MNGGVDRNVLFFLFGFFWLFAFLCQFLEVDMYMYMQIRPDQKQHNSKANFPNFILQEWAALLSRSGSKLQRIVDFGVQGLCNT